MNIEPFNAPGAQISHAAEQDEFSVVNLQQYKPGATVRELLAAAILISLSACGWVDSTGRSSASEEDSSFGVSPATSGTGATQSPENIIDIPETRIVQLQENNRVRVTPNELISDALDWTWTPVAEGNPLLECNRLGDFNGTLAANNLRNSCSDGADCDLGIEAALNTSGNRVFDVATPTLKSPVALRYRLSGFSPDGNTYNEYYSFCLISINEAPTVVEDVFTVVRGDTLRVRGNDAINLLSNDTDDVDASNLPLAVNSLPINMPQLAESFSLQTDGGFIYVAPSSGGPGTDFDSFDYEVTDGIHKVRTTARIRIVDSNQAPTLVARLPDLMIVTGQTISDDDASYDLSGFFVDPDGDPLQFSTVTGSLPSSNNLRLTSNGQLTGRATELDIGEYTVTVIASDGRDTMRDTFTLSIAADPSSSDNQAPVIAPLDELIIEQGQRINLSVSASDADGDDLTYSLSTTSADFLSINASNGRLRGVAAAPGLYPVTVLVSDSVSTTRRTFFLRVIRGTNRAPLVDDIANAVFNDPFSYDVSVFFVDPDGDPMTFTAQFLPTGVSISDDGIVSGAPTNANAGPHFILVTADDNNLGTTSDGFLLTLVP